MSIQVYTAGVWKTVGDTFPAGTITMYGGTSAPNGWLLCDGSAVSRTTYADLFVAIGINFGAGDGSTTFNLPDMREAAPVGVGTRASGVFTHDNYALNQFKDDQFQGHLMSGWSGNAGGSFNYFPGNNAGVEGTPYGARLIADSLGNGTPRIGTTTHGKRIGLNFIIKI